MREMLRAILVVVVAVSAAAGAAAAPASDGGFSGEIEVVLWDGLFQGIAPDEAPQNLVLNLEAARGSWDRVWGMALGYNNGLHVGLVRDATVGPDAVRLEVAMRIGGDIWVKGGPASYTIDLKRGQGGRLEGTFEGTFKGHHFSGRAVGEIRPPRPVRVENFKPVQEGEHPRLFFRKHDLPRLRERLATPFGQAYLERAKASGDVVSLGMLYQLTGETQYARRAMERVREVQRDSEIYTSDHGAGSGGWGHTLVAVALAYDLCFDAWPESFRKEVDDRLLPVLPLLIQYLAVTSHANRHPCSNYYGPGHGAPAIASLLYYGDKGPAPERPADPAARPVVIEPFTDYEPGPGVPVVEYESAQVPGKWLYAGPIPGAIRPEAVQGHARRPPQEGTEIEYFMMGRDGPETASVTFKRVPEAAITGSGVDAARLAGTGGAATSILYTVLKVNADERVGFAPGQPDTTAWLAGAELRAGKSYQLRAGLYPMLVVHATEKSRGAIAPRLADFGSEALAAGRAEYEMALAAWKADTEAWERSGGTDLAKMETIDLGWRRVYRHYRLGIGDGGFQAETGAYARIATWYPLVYATIYRNMFGRDASPYPDVTHLMPRRMMQVLFRDDGKPMVQKLNSDVGFDPGWCAAAFPIVPDEYKPSLLWAWNRAMGVTDESSRANLFGEGGLRGGVSLAHAFLHYPLDMEAVHPSRGMPLTWEAPTFGFYCFRSGWASDDDFIGQVFLKASPVGGWNHPNGGAFRILGLGRPWVTGPTSRNGVREQESVVLLPDDQVSQGSCGRLAFLETQKDGSAVLTIDMNDIYAPEGTRSHDRNGLRLPGRSGDSPITGLRAMAFDYSGAGGTPAMMVLVDKITGGGRKLWCWQVPEGMIGKVQTAGNAFSMDYGDASMKATFVAPANVRIEAASEAIQVRDARHGFHGTVNRVKATGGDDFFVVVTFQRGDPPDVEVQGRGLGAKARVGGQTVRFDGEKIILGR